MKLHIVKRITHFGKNSLIDTYHFTMFHGWAVRGAHPDEDVSYALGDRLEHPLKLYLNTFRVSDVIQPRLNLLLKAEAVNNLRKQTQVELLECVTAGVCQIPYVEGDFSHWDHADYFDDGEQPKRILLEAVQPPKSDDGPKYYEVVCPDLERVAGASQARTINVTLPKIDAEVEFPAEKTVFNEFPLLWHDGFFLFSDELFQDFQTKLNWNYFVSASVDMG